MKKFGIWLGFDDSKAWSLFWMFWARPKGSCQVVRMFYPAFVAPASPFSPQFAEPRSSQVFFVKDEQGQAILRLNYGDGTSKTVRGLNLVPCGIQLPGPDALSIFQLPSSTMTLRLVNKQPWSFGILVSISDPLLFLRSKQRLFCWSSTMPIQGMVRTILLRFECPRTRWPSL